MAGRGSNNSEGPASLLQRFKLGSREMTGIAAAPEKAREGATTKVAAAVDSSRHKKSASSGS
jgi:hypothetical protein